MSSSAAASSEAIWRTNAELSPVAGNAKGKALSSMAMTMRLRRRNRGNITVHGFRGLAGGLLLLCFGGFAGNAIVTRLLAAWPFFLTRRLLSGASCKARLRSRAA